MAPQPPFPWRRTMKPRIVLMGLLFVVWAIGIEARLVYLQVIEHDDLTARASRQHMRTIEAPAKRGEILDRNGRVLAVSVDVDSVYAVPMEIEDAKAATARLCEALGDCTDRDRSTLVERLERRRPFAYVRRQVTPEQAGRVAALKLDGLGFMKETRRYYPNRELAAHLLGYVGIDSDGLAGIESTYDGLIKGRPGAVLIQTDARRQAFSRLERPPTAGGSLELTIDEQLQHAAERELRAGVQRAGAAGGSAVVMDPRTGEILAIANHPTFNPNEYREFREDRRRNRAVQDLYEPGSTFKIVTAGAALQDETFAPATTIQTSPGVIRFGSRAIDEDKGRDYGPLSFTDVMVKSSNVGAIKVGLRVGADRMVDYVRRFGFGQTSSPDFRGESPGIVWSAANLTDSALASVSMGYQVAVTPLQMATAVSVVANGGELVQPRVVRSVIRDGRRALVPRKIVRRVLDRETAVDLTAIMEQVVERGTGKQSQVPGYRVAGKTGTAQKIVSGRYSHTDYNVSFVGFVPSRDPAFAIVVVVDTPRKMPPYGGTVAAPIFSRIAEAALRRAGIPPALDPSPQVLVATHRQAPEAAVRATPAIVPVSRREGRAEPVVPDLRGLSGRDALRVMVRLGFPTRLHGHGLVVEQHPDPGTPIEEGVQAALWLDRWPEPQAEDEPRP
ncbi:MAG: PASTA domain-containing protein [Acidimicrobiia bacterium]|nr:PASTA domain-containing protein [Acidimicrobiia bacterium]